MNQRLRSVLFYLSVLAGVVCVGIAGLVIVDSWLLITLLYFMGMGTRGLCLGIGILVTVGGGVAFVRAMHNIGDRQGAGERPEPVDTALVLLGMTLWPLGVVTILDFRNAPFIHGSDFYAVLLVVTAALFFWCAMKTRRKKSL